MQGCCGLIKNEKNLNDLASFALVENAFTDYGNQQGSVDNNTIISTESINSSKFNPVRRSGGRPSSGFGCSAARAAAPANYLFFLGGFVEGEGSNSVSISVGRSFKYGINIQPVFNVSQHENGLKILESFKTYFGVGSVVQKSGAPHVWVYTVKGYKHIIKHVIPFLETYVQPYSCKTNEYQIFKQLVLMSEAGGQKNKETLIEMVKIAYTLIGKGKGRKRTLSVRRGT